MRQIESNKLKFWITKRETVWARTQAWRRGSHSEGRTASARWNHFFLAAAAVGCVQRKYLKWQFHSSNSSLTVSSNRWHDYLYTYSVGNWLWSINKFRCLFNKRSLVAVTVWQMKTKRSVTNTDHWESNTNWERQTKKAVESEEEPEIEAFALEKPDWPDCRNRAKPQKVTKVKKRQLLKIRKQWQARDA